MESVSSSSCMHMETITFQTLKEDAFNCSPFYVSDSFILAFVRVLTELTIETSAYTFKLYYLLAMALKFDTRGQFNSFSIDISYNWRCLFSMTIFDNAFLSPEKFLSSHYSFLLPIFLFCYH